MEKGLDFLIGGMPRGGTTAVGNLFNLPQRSWCYASESHFLPLMREFAADRPVPAVSLPLVRDILERHNRQVLLEMPRFSISRGASPGALLFAEDDLPRLTAALMEALAAGLSGAALQAVAMAILREALARKTGRQVLGEKSPDNIFSFDTFPQGTETALISVTREPFAVLRSMRKRGADAADPNNAPFRQDLYRLLGIWLEYAGAMAALRGRPNHSLLRYEDMLRKPGRTVAALYAAAGVQASWLERWRAGRRLRDRAAQPAWKTFPPEERALMLALSASLRDAQGYGAAFYAAQGLDVRADAAGVAPDGVMPAWGVNPRAPGEPGLWLMREGCLGVHTVPEAGSTALRLWCNFPLSVAAPGESVILSLTDPASGVELGRAEVAAGFAGEVPVTLDLTGISPALEGGGGAVRLVRFRSSHAWRGYLTPGTQGSVVSPDRREVSFALLT